MKFAKEIEDELVPEWRAKYMNYKVGKKKLKAVTRAVRSLQSNTPRLPGSRFKPAKWAPSPYEPAPQYSFLNRVRSREARSAEIRTEQPRLRPQSQTQSQTPTKRQVQGENKSQAGSDSEVRSRSKSLSKTIPQDEGSHSRPRDIPSRKTPEERPLKSLERDRHSGYARYGSIISTPPGKIYEDRGRHAPLLELPEPALDSAEASPRKAGNEVESMSDLPAPKQRVKSPRFAGLNDEAPVSQERPGGAENESTNAFQVGIRKTPPKDSHRLSLRHRSIFMPKRINSSPNIVTRPKHSFRRMLSVSFGADVGTPGSHPHPDSIRGAGSDVQLEFHKELDYRQAEFFQFLDQELEKIETFYKEKEEEATERLKTLREQLHIMRDRRLDELISIRTARMKKKKSTQAVLDVANGSQDSSESSEIDKKKGDSNGNEQAGENGHDHGSTWRRPLDRTFEQIYNGRIGKSTKAMGLLGTPPGPRPSYDHRDYSRRTAHIEIPYRTAKRKLKIALQEYYRGLELLKGYALLNRKAFRKINKKYDKAVNARPAMRYVNEKVNNAWFVQSEVLDGHIRVVEDLYARYFERGNHKVAAGKLRAKSRKAGDFTAAVFRNGLCLAAGAVFGIEGTIYGAQLLYKDDRLLAIRTGFLLQIYAGYFLILLLMLLFCLVCRVWHKARINYPFIFEYESRSQLDWRQLVELPAILAMLLGLTIRLNFQQVGGEAMYIYWPVVLIGLTVLILCFPARILYVRSRIWFLYTNWRLLLSGLYPVEFRDFFMGDMFCSLTYAFGNIELFFCLYARNWREPAQCNSSHSRLLGFFACLPGIWRALQCIRRYYDTRNIFPHLVNCGKYTFTILFYMSLSLWRIHRTESLRILFIVFASINATYCTIWDIVMDWSLFNPYAPNPFLRDVLGYKSAWPYYLAMTIDPILRFNWIFYAIFANDMQHSAILSFVVSLSEVLRRAMWTIFRVENEHCTNVGMFRASRDVPLPYMLETETDTVAGSSAAGSPVVHADGAGTASTTGADIATPKPAARTPGTPATAPKPPSEHPSTAHSTGLDLEAQRTHSSTQSKRRRARAESAANKGTLSRMGTLLHLAHAQDFERKRRPSDEDGKAEGLVGGDDGDDESDGSDGSEACEDGGMERVAAEEGLLGRESEGSEGEDGGERVEGSGRR